MPRTLLCLITTLCAPALAHAQPSPEAVFLEAWTLARDNFYDPAMHAVDWDAVRTELLPAARAATTSAQTSRVINDALDRLHASHTRHYHPGEREYYELLDIFNPDAVTPEFSTLLPPGPVSYVGVGVITQTIDTRTFAIDVYPTGPADRAGVVPGDELLAVEDAPWSDIDAFRDREGLPTRLSVRRGPDEAPTILTVTPARIRPRELFLAAMNASARVIDHDAHRIAYVRVRSYAHPAYHNALVELTRTRFKDAHALVLDLRGPWGGANPEYLNLFNPTIPSFASRARDAEWNEPSLTWRKPVALVIDPSVRSGKEILAHAFRTHALGPLIGETTGGAVLGGRPFVLQDTSILYLAVLDVRIDGRRLEGVGVAPTVSVKSPPPMYRRGADPAFNAALHELARTLAIPNADRQD